jgi:hypothetical protein
LVGFWHTLTSMAVQHRVAVVNSYSGADEIHGIGRSFAFASSARVSKVCFGRPG